MSQMDLNRRDLLRAGGAAGGAALLAGCRRREQRIVGQPLYESDALPGASVWRTAICGQCRAGCAFSVRTVDEMAKKIEGMPQHPVNHGGVCALGHSALQELYNPDRILSPLRRTSERGATNPQFEPISWEAALEDIGRALADSRARRPSARGIGIVTPPTGVVDRLWRRFAEALDGASVYLDRPATEEVELLAAREVFGWSELPVYHLGPATFIVSFGACFLDRWHSPVHYAHEFTEMRTKDGTRFVHAAPRNSLTAAAADFWLPLRPGTEGVLARSLAGAVIEAGRARPEDVTTYQALYPEPPPSLEQAASHCDVPLHRVVETAQRLVSTPLPVALAGGEGALSQNGLATTSAALALDLLLGADRIGLVAPSTTPENVARSIDTNLEPATLGDLRKRLDQEVFDVLLVSESDPLRRFPASWSTREALARIGKIVALSAFFDDTTVEADLVLPIQTDLERHSAVVPPASRTTRLLSVSRPAVAARGEARHPGDLILALARTQSQLASELPWESWASLVETTILGPHPVGEHRQLLDRAFEDGAITAGAETAEEPSPSSAEPAASSAPLREPGVGPVAPPGSVLMLPFAAVKSDHGRGSNRPWLQELPDPISSVMWNSWAEIAVADAERLGLETGDWVRLSGPHGAVEVGVVISPAARPGTVAVPLGGGYRDYGRYAQSRGVNPLDLIGTERVEGTDVPTLSAAPIELTKTSRRKGRRLLIYGEGLRSAADRLGEVHQISWYRSRHPQRGERE